MIVIGDVHGCLKTLKALIAKLPSDEKICFVGDLIDRGPDSRGVVDYVKELVETGKADCVMGNHEKMMIDWTGRFSDMLWLGNGGQQTRDNYFENASMIPYSKGEFNNEAFEAHKDWFKTLPVYIEYKDVKNAEGRHLVVSHSHVSPVWDRMKRKDLSEKDLEICHKTITWGRPNILHDPEEIYNIIGHTPREKARVRSFYANIDSGCFWKKDMHKGEFGHLTAIQFPEMNLFTQECIDEVNW